MDYMPELMFNIDNGYLEGLVRGFKSGILTRTDYLNLIQCETLEGNMKFSQLFLYWNRIQIFPFKTYISLEEILILCQFFM